MLRIVTDGSVDMPVEWKSLYDIQVIPLTVTLGGKEIKPGIDMTTSEFYNLMRTSRQVPKSSLPSPMQVAEFYRSIFKKGDDILSIHVSSKVSGTFNTCLLGAQELSNEINIHVMDSMAGSAALGFLCRQARNLSETGNSLKDIITRLTKIKESIHISFTVENLDFAYLSGRIGRLQSIMGSLLKINPIISLNEGKLTLGERVRTKKNAINRLFDSIQGMIKDQLVSVAIVHAGDLETAKTMAEKAKHVFNTNEIIISDLSVPVAANLGPGTVGLVTYPVV